MYKSALTPLSTEAPDPAHTATERTDDSENKEIIITQTNT